MDTVHENEGAITIVISAFIIISEKRVIESGWMDGSRPILTMHIRHLGILDLVN